MTEAKNESAYMLQSAAAEMRKAQLPDVESKCISHCGWLKYCFSSGIVNV